MVAPTCATLRAQSQRRISISEPLVCPTTPSRFYVYMIKSNRDSLGLCFALWLRSCVCVCAFPRSRGDQSLSTWAPPSALRSLRRCWCAPAFACESFGHIVILGSALLVLCRPNHTSSTCELNSPTRIDEIVSSTGDSAHMQK